MAQPQQLNAEVEFRFIKLAYSSLLKTVECLSDDVDVHQTVRQHMLTVCEGVRVRALEAAGDTSEVDGLINMINEYFDYSQSPLFPAVEIVRRNHD